MTLRIYTIILFAAFSIVLLGQTSPLEYRFRVYLKDKGSEMEYSVDNPQSFLSKRAIERKRKERVDIDSTDFPVSKNYLQIIANSGGKIVSKSKWFNTCVVQLKDSLQIEAVRLLPFVDSVKYIWRGNDQRTTHLMRPRLEPSFCEDTVSEKDFFGISREQFALHKADRMIKAGFRGKGIAIAVIDAGFTNVDVIPYFAKYNLLGYKDFVPNGYIFSANDHGTKVLSTMAVNQPYLMIGSAPEASYWLLRSEDSQSEFPVEEDFWVEAIEFADSVGVDIVNTSLGYSDFDDPSLSYRYEQMNGSTSLMTRAADKAFEKGILLVCSAGNEGNKPWGKITVPSDAFHALTVGAVLNDSTIAKFSSLGPTADGRIRPDLVSSGVGVATINQNGVVGWSNGTSFSSPYLAGLIASLWSINPRLTRTEILHAVKESADRYNRPDTVFGYGIPDFSKAMQTVLQSIRPAEELSADDVFSVSMDHSKNYISVQLLDREFPPNIYGVRLLPENGMILYENKLDENYRLNFRLNGSLKKQNQYLYIVIDSPLELRVARLKI
ncbi:hypothetical protein C0T31_04925 [Dysgonamonadaceae bacterium]|nr:hypothetical protein C0T31_04925 [Dysgonamonadaceae bacterium]